MHQGPKPPVLSPYRRPKPFAPWPSGTQRPREPPRLAHFRNHMPSPPCAWKSKLLREENKSQLNFLSTCQTALCASPAELCSTLVASYQILMGQSPMSLPLSPSQGPSSSEPVPAPMAPLPPAPEPSPRPKQ